MILERTGYPLDVTTGQRKYGGPPPNWEGAIPGTGCEVSSSFFLFFLSICMYNHMCRCSFFRGITIRSACSLTLLYNFCGYSRANDNPDMDQHATSRLKKIQFLM